MDFWRYKRVLWVLESGVAAPALLGVIFLTFSINYASAKEQCTAYFNTTGALIPGEDCDEFCCGSVYKKYCCSNCSLSISQSGTCLEEEWDPTGTIIQGAFMALWFVIILLVWGLQSNGCLDTGRCPRRRKHMPGPPPSKSYTGAYPKQVTMPASLPPDPQSMQLAEESAPQSSLPFSRPQSDAGSDADDTPAADSGLINPSDAAILQINDGPSHDTVPIISDPSVSDFDGETLHSVEVHPEPSPRRDYGSTEQIIPLGSREAAGFEQNNQAFVDTPLHAPKHPGRLPPVDQNRTETPSSIVLSVRPSPEPVELDMLNNQPRVT
ncbi:uncharacterized protein LOC135502143 isoform X2 [Lineus longissimus]|uniref:uncharacterized protein LOC135502143 isoform X2 n=1 Tax=Lineus longissimus TaxID=88925 RepID=UPI002B4EFB4D